MLCSLGRNKYEIEKKEGAGRRMKGGGGKLSEKRGEESVALSGT
jgi:hypothetical protein